jgi:hypothetical protein
MKTTILKTVLLVMSISIFGCSKSDEPELPTTSGNATDVYIVGYTMNSGNKAVPTIWKNGIPAILPSDANVNTVGFKIAVSSNDVYAVNGIDGTNQIIMWKNGISSVVAQDAKVEDLIVDNGNVYILGRKKGFSYRYWKNGVETILTNGLSGNFVKDMVVVNGDVHIAGSVEVGSSNVVKYWKNGAATSVSNPNFRAFANGIAVDGLDVYVLFRELETNGTYTLKIWKNGAITTLESGIHNDFSMGKGKIVTTPNTVFVTAGLSVDNETSKIGFWKNGLKTNLTSGNASSIPDDMKITGNDAHIIGRERNPGADGKFVLKYWKNGLETILTSDADGSFNNAAMAISKNGDVHIVGNNKYFLNNAPTVLQGNKPEALDIFTVN